MRYYKFTRIQSAVSDDTINKLLKANKPKNIHSFILTDFVCLFGKLFSFIKKCFVTSLNDVYRNLTIGQVLSLADVSKDDCVRESIAIYFGIPKWRINIMSVDRVFGLYHYVCDTAQHITKLMEQTNVPPLPEEVQAGCNELGKNGAMMLFDYLSKRDNISIDAAHELNWQVVVAELKIDKDKVMYQRRLDNVLNKR